MDRPRPHEHRAPAASLREHGPIAVFYVSGQAASPVAKAVRAFDAPMRKVIGHRINELAQHVGGAPHRDIDRIVGSDPPLWELRLCRQSGQNVRALAITDPEERRFTRLVVLHLWNKKTDGPIDRNDIDTASQRAKDWLEHRRPRLEAIRQLRQAQLVNSRNLNRVQAAAIQREQGPRLTQLPP
jgi:phage-related protein